MKFSPRHLACLLLLLSSLSGAEASMLQSGDSSLGAHYIGTWVTCLMSCPAMVMLPC